MPPGTARDAPLGQGYALARSGSVLLEGVLDFRGITDARRPMAEVILGRLRPRPPGRLASPLFSGRGPLLSAGGPHGIFPRNSAPPGRWLHGMDPWSRPCGTSMVRAGRRQSGQRHYRDHPVDTHGPPSRQLNQESMYLVDSRAYAHRFPGLGTGLLKTIPHRGIPASTTAMASPEEAGATTGSAWPWSWSRHGGTVKSPTRTPAVS